MFVKQGHKVFALARATSSGERVRALGATPITGNFEGSEQLSLPEIEAVVHAAAYFRFAGPRAPYFRANVEGTRALMTAARKAGATTFIYLRASGIVMDDRGSPIRDADERAPSFSNSFSSYIASKSQGEAAVVFDCFGIAGIAAVAALQHGIRQLSSRSTQSTPGRQRNGSLRVLTELPMRPR
jgi:nucleoside-diphosphate-sugar epimerase